uniref:DMT family transporter n=1 Tax=Herbidospora sakaeratensis TaxID=564415 RepID=UPI001FDFC91C|nr:DMT family transporter [Herbidospora sakaeratensis]
MPMTWLGFTIALLGALGYALGAALQQFEAVAQGATLRLVRRPRWWIGGIISFSGACLHAVALSLAPLIIVQPISVATLVFAVPLAAWLHGRKAHRAEYLGSLAVAVGLLWLMLLVPAHNVKPSMSTGEGVGMILVVALIAAASFVSARFFAGPGKAIWMSIGAGAVTATVSTFVRVVGANFDGAWGELLHWTALAIPLLLVAAVVLLQKSYEVGYFGIAYATVQIVDPITSITAGTVLLGEPLPAGVGQVVPALVATAILVWGTITLSRLAPDHSPVPEAKPEPVTV